jgi:membrane protein implicated in regulation of membrane protease activity
MGILATIGLGLAGTFVGGIVAWLLLGHAGGVIFSLLCATLLLYLHRRFIQHRPLTGPGSRQLPPR